MSIHRLFPVFAGFAGMAAVFCVSQAAAQDDSFHPVFARRALVIGSQIADNVRTARIDVGEIQKSVAVDRKNLLTVGPAVGMIFPVSGALRLQIGLNADIGTVVDDTLFTAETVAVRNFYYHAGLEPQLHLAPWHSRRFAPFLLIGAGGNCVWVQERTFLLKSPTQEIIYTDRKYVSAMSFSFNVSAGLGCDIALGRRIGIFLSNYFRYLYPVTHKINQDFPLFEMPYREAWYGDVSCLGISIKLR